MNGSPTCTEGRSSADSSVISLEAKAAPAMPSLPVEEPTIKTGLPGPFEVALITFFVSIIPAENALTSGLVLYDSSKKTSPPTIGIPNEFP